MSDATSSAATATATLMTQPRLFALFLFAAPAASLALGTTSLRVAPVRPALRARPPTPPVPTAERLRTRMRTTLRYAAPRPPQTDGWRAERYALRAQIGEFLRRKQAAAAERLQAAAAEELPADVQPLLSGAAAPALPARPSPPPAAVSANAAVVSPIGTAPFSVCFGGRRGRRRGLGPSRWPQAQRRCGWKCSTVSQTPLFLQ